MSPVRRHGGAIAKTLANLEAEHARLTDERSRIGRELEQLDAAIAALRPLAPVVEASVGGPARPTSPPPDGMLTRLRDELRKHPGEILSPRNLAELTGYTAGVVAMQCTRLGPEVEHMVGRGYRWKGAA